MTKYLESDGSRMWSALTGTGIRFRLGRLAKVLDLVLSCVSPDVFPKIGGKMLLRGRSAEAQTVPNDLAVRYGEPPRHFCTITSGVSAQLCVTPGLHISYTIVEHERSY